MEGKKFPSYKEGPFMNSFRRRALSRFSRTPTVYFTSSSFARRNGLYMKRQLERDGKNRTVLSDATRKTRRSPKDSF